MKELELTSNAALTDVVYEAALNGSLLNVKLVTGAVGDDEIRGLIPEANHYHVTHPKTSEEILFEQPLDASDKQGPGIWIGGIDSITRRWLSRHTGKRRKSHSHST